MAKTAVYQKQLTGLLVVFGLLLSVLLAVGAYLLNWGQSFASDTVRSNLVQEKIYFPKAGTPALDPKEFPGLQKYAGSQVDTGVKAKAYADEFIWVHMMKASGGKTYAEVSAAASANKSDAKLAALKTTLFQGDMLRSSLLTAYAFSVFGLVAYYAKLALGAAAVIVLLLSLLGVLKLRRE
jgi:hypothetical protein